MLMWGGQQTCSPHQSPKYRCRHIDTRKQVRVQRVKPGSAGVLLRCIEYFLRDKNRSTASVSNVVLWCGHCRSAWSGLGIKGPTGLLRVIVLPYVAESTVWSRSVQQHSDYIGKEWAGPLLAILSHSLRHPSNYRALGCSVSWTLQTLQNVGAQPSCHHHQPPATCMSVRI